MKIKTIGYQLNFPKCPYKIRSGNKCSHKSVGKFCSRSKAEDCPYYNDWLIKRKAADNGFKDDLELLEVEDETRL